MKMCFGAIFVLPLSFALAACTDNTAVSRANEVLDSSRQFLCELSLTDFVELSNKSDLQDDDIRKAYIDILDYCGESMFLAMSGAATDIASVAYDEWEARENCADPDVVLTRIDAALEQKAECDRASDAAGLNPVQRLHSTLEVCNSMPDLSNLSAHALACSNAESTPEDIRSIMAQHVRNLTAD